MPAGLWGTVLNEGAMKGILVTTADDGPDMGFYLLLHVSSVFNLCLKN